MFIDQTGVLNENQGEVFGLKVKLGQGSLEGTVKSQSVPSELNCKLERYFQLSGQGLKPLCLLGETPLVSQLAVGDSRLVVLNFEPEETELFTSLVGELLRQDELYPNLLYQGDVVARVYESKEGYTAVGITYTPTKNHNKNQYQVLPFKDPEAKGTVKIKFEPETDYYVLYYLEGKTSVLHTDAEGWLSVPLEGAHYGLAFIVEAEKKALLAEKETQAKELVGYWESDQIELPEKVRLGK